MTAESDATRPRALAAQRLLVIGACTLALITACCLAPALIADHAEQLRASVHERVLMEEGHERLQRFIGLRIGCASLAYLLISVLIATAGHPHLRRWAAIHAGVAAVGLAVAVPFIIQG